MDANPFEFGRELSADELVDRQPDLAVVERCMLEGGKLFLVGPRRFGKTSLLAAAAARAAARGALVLRYNVEAFPSLEMLVARLVADTAARLAGPVERAAAAVGRFFAALRPAVSYSPAEQTWSATLAPAGGLADVPLLAEALEGLERAAADRARPTALVLDEFQAAIERGGPAAEGQVRAAVQAHRHVGYVFAGSRTRLLTAMTHDASRPFYRLGTTLFLGPVPREDFAAFLRRGLAAVSDVTDEGVTAILDGAEDVPYNVQLLAHACWERARETAERPRLDAAFVAGVHRAAALRLDPVYSQLWTSLPPTQQRALLALVETGGAGLTSAAVTGRYGVPVPSMQSALEALEAKGVTRPDARDGTSRPRLEDPLYGVWLRATVPFPPP